MINEIQSLVDQYSKWLTSKNTLRQIDDWVEITTPFLDRHNDHLQIYVSRKDDGYLLTDDGYILNDLELSGCTIESPKRISLLHDTLNGFGVKKNKVGALEILATKSNFPKRKHNLLQAMLAVNDLFYLAEPMIVSIFKADVAAWLDKNDIRYTPDVKFTGISGFDHRFDFVIPKSSKEPERILHTINQPGKTFASNLAFSWIDTKDVRPPNSKAYGIINDVGGAESTVAALGTYKIKAVLWSNRQEVLTELTA